jgi:hypothetical protein
MIVIVGYSPSVGSHSGLGIGRHSGNKKDLSLEGEALNERSELSPAAA